MSAAERQGFRSLAEQRRELREERKRRALVLNAEGLSAVTIGARLGLSSGTVLEFLHEAGVRPAAAHDGLSSIRHPKARRG